MGSSSILLIPIMASILRCVLLQISVFALLLFSSEAQQCISSEKQALLEIKAGFQDSQAYLADWNSTNCCIWTGVTCDRNGGHVVGLDLSQKEVGGVLSTSIGRLAQLQNLSMASTGISGTIPSSLGSLPKLQVLNLGSNFKLGGGIPSSLGNLKNLKELDLSGCNLTGKIPTSFKNFNLLQTLQLSLNAELSGTIEWLGNLYRLESVRLSNTKISGSIPSTIGRLSKLQYLDLSSTDISGSIPNSIGSLLSLQHLEITNTKISGAVPATLGKLSNLQELYLYSNHLSGSLPDSLGNLHNLTDLNLSNNLGLSGTIPKSFGQLSNLDFLTISYTSISGQIPATLGVLSKVRQIDLSYNHLSGAIPEGFARNLSGLNTLDLSHNKITGLPSDMSGLSSLSSLLLHNNTLSFSSIKGVATIPNLYFLGLANCGLSGNVPNIFPSSLGDLVLSQNRITGVDSDYSNLHQLTDLVLEQNKLTLDKLGGLHGLTALLRLFLASNRLQGQIKDGILPFSLVNLEMNNNKITGLPDHMGNFTSLAGLTLDDNDLSFEKISGLATAPALGILSLRRCKLIGQIPKWLATLQMQTLPGRSFMSPVELHLSFNNISGQIPSEFEENTKLGLLHLQNNLLTGGIPSTLAGMSLLKYIDFSSNKLSGSIPPAFANRTTTWQEFNVSNNQLSGRIPEGLAFQGLTASSFQGNLGLCGTPLPACA